MFNFVIGMIVGGFLGLIIGGLAMYKGNGGNNDKNRKN